MFVDVDDEHGEVAAVFEELVGRVEHGTNARGHGDEVGRGQRIDHGAFDASGHVGGLVEGVVGGEFEFEVDRVGKVGGEETEGDDAGGDESADEDEGGHKNRDHGVADAQGEVEEMGVDLDRPRDHAVDGFAEFLVGESEFIAQTAPAARRIFRGFGAAGGSRTDGAQAVGEVRGQDEKGLGQGEDERRNDDDGNDGEEFSDDAFAPDEREEGGDCRAHAAEDGPDDFARAAHGGFHGTFALAVEAENIFPDDDGIIDHHAEGHDHAEEREHVDGEAAGVEDEEGAGKGKRNAESDEQGEAPIEEEEKKDGYEDERLDAVLHHGFDAGIDVFGGVADDLRLDLRREEGGFGGKDTAGFADGLDDIGAFLFDQRVGHGGAEVGASVGLCFLGCFFDRADVADFHGASVGAFDHGEVLELCGFGDFAEEADDALSTGGVEAPAHDIDVFGRDGLGHVAEGEAGEAEAVGVNFDPDFTALESVDEDFGDAGDEFEAALDFVEHRANFAHVETGRIGNSESDEREGDIELFDDGRFGRGGQVGFCFVDGLADIIEDGLDVFDGRVDFDEDVGKVVLRDGADFLEIIDVAEFLLDGNGDGAFDVLGGPGLRIKGGDLDEIRADVGKKVALQLCGGRVVAGENDHQRENIDRNAVLHAPRGKTHRLQL